MIAHADLKVGDPIWLACGFAGIARISVVDKDPTTGLVWVSHDSRSAYIAAPRLMFRTEDEAQAGNDAWLSYWRDVTLGFAQLTENDIAATPDDADRLGELRSALAAYRASADVIAKWFQPYTSPDEPPPVDTSVPPAGEPNPGDMDYPP